MVEGGGETLPEFFEAMDWFDLFDPFRHILVFDRKLSLLDEPYLLIVEFSIDDGVADIPQEPTGVPGLSNGCIMGGMLVGKGVEAGVYFPGFIVMWGVD